jgi:hypothetical protein
VQGLMEKLSVAIKLAITMSGDEQVTFVAENLT